MRYCFNRIRCPQITQAHPSCHLRPCLLPFLIFIAIFKVDTRDTGEDLVSQNVQSSLLYQDFKAVFPSLIIIGLYTWFVEG